MIVNSGEELPELPITTQNVSRSISEAGVWLRTNDDIGVAGFDIGDLNVYAAVDEEEIRGKGVTCQ